MGRQAALMILSLAASSCGNPSGKLSSEESNSYIEKPNGADVAWAKCLFDLDKTEALRGRNLDDLDKGGGSARNQFMMDCLWSYGEAPTPDQLENMAAYKSGKLTRKAGDVSLNSGSRK